MADNTQWLADAKARLAISQGSRRRKGSIAAKVEALRPEIEAARAAGKTWKQIARDISDGEELNEDAVRIAFNRGGKARSTTPASTSGGASKQTAASKPVDVSQPIKASEPSGGPVGTSKQVDAAKLVGTPAPPSAGDEALIRDMFAPMYDARDTRGRGAGQTSVEEAQS
jgi:hypothetical protein